MDKGCIAGRYMMAVDSKGGFMPCPHMKTHSSSFEKIFDYWQSDATILKLREEFKKNSSNKNCQMCKFKRYCNPCYSIDSERMQNLTKFDQQCVCFYEVNKNEGMSVNA
jgi:radical SAM protein with 4Fe4S-binding SPASM domain